MPAVIAVKFAYAARDLWFDPGSTGAVEGDHVICSTERGTEIGLATSDPREVGSAELTQMIGNAVLKPVLRIATDEDLLRAEVLAQRGDEAFPLFRAHVAQADLDIKPVGVEYLFGGEKVVCYFAAEERVDFRQLVRDLSRELRERIDMRQIGVREEAAVVGGFGHCGQELCCSRFGLSFEPVSIRMAKEQDLPLTSNKISGACGRLMCCLRYEFEAYRDFKGRAPKRNAIIDTPLGKAKIVEYDTPKEQLALRLENGKVVRIPLAEMVTSDAAKKKSEELHCPCRPDTVVRESLEKLSSPDVQMALAELDRKMGVVPIDAFDETDIFVEAKPRRRRSRKGATDVVDGESAVQAPSSMPSAVEQPSRRTRRRRGGKAAGEGGTVAPQAPMATEASAVAEDADKKSRRRRRKRSSSTNASAAASVAIPQEGGSPTQPAASSVQQPKETRRRRHHRAPGADVTADTAQGKGQAVQRPQGSQGQQGRPAQQGQQQKGVQKPRRRPGDRAGQQKTQEQQRSPQAQTGQASAQDPSAPKRRRRRRGGRGRGGNAQGGEQPGNA